MTYRHPVESLFPDASGMCLADTESVIVDLLEGSRVPFYQLLPLIRQTE